MESNLCPKCNQPMDEGYLSASDATFGYVSQKQRGMVRRPTNIERARACPSCGYVELYLDPKTLKPRLA
jgi:predicted nucleic-acid-binding Zn-ribbon protein